MADLHVYTNGADWLVAEGPRHAAKLGGYDPEEETEHFALVADDKEISIFDEDAGDRVTRTASEWVRENGPGLLCSTEY